MTTTIRTSRFADLRGASSVSQQDDPLPSPNQGALGNTLSGNGPAAWNTNIWRNGTIGRNSATVNKDSAVIKDLTSFNDDNRQGSSSLVPESDPWNRRRSNWTSAESTSTSPVELRRASAFTDLSLRGGRQTQAGRFSDDIRPEAFGAPSTSINPPPTTGLNVNPTAFELNGDSYATLPRRVVPNPAVTSGNLTFGDDRDIGRSPTYARWPDSAVSLSPADDGPHRANAASLGSEKDVSLRNGTRAGSLYGQAGSANWHKRENYSWSQDPSNDLFDRSLQPRGGNVTSKPVFGRPSGPSVDLPGVNISSNFDRLGMGASENNNDQFVHYPGRRVSGPDNMTSLRDQQSGWSRIPSISRPGQIRTPNATANFGSLNRGGLEDNLTSRPSFPDSFDTFRGGRTNGTLSPLSNGIGMSRSVSGQPCSPTDVSANDNSLVAYARGDFNNHNTVNGRLGNFERRFAPINQEAEQLMQDQMQQFMTNQLYGQYCPPLAYPNSTERPFQQLQVPQYHVMPGIGSRPVQQDIESNQSLRSDILEEFKSHHKGSRRWELREIYDHIVEFSGDQHGSRFIQHKLETANSEEKERVFREIQPNATQLMTDVFGNYVIQKFFEHGDQYQKKILANRMKGRILSLSLQIYGCRVVQKALEHVLVDQQASMVQELDGDGVVLRCIKDQNGNHVIQKAIERVPLEHIGFIIEVSLSQIRSLAVHGYGCRVVQRLLERCDNHTKAIMLQELHACASTLIPDHFGNYVTQHVIESGSTEDRNRLISLVMKNLIPYSRQKCASNVVEKCIIYGTNEQRHEMMVQFMSKNQQGENILPLLIKDQFANYVIQRLLDTLNGNDYKMFTIALEPEIAKFTSRRLLPNKQAENVAKKMHRFDPSAPTITNVNGVAGNNGSDSSALPTPPLTSDGLPTPMSTSLPSTQGDEWSGKGRESDTISGAIEPSIKVSLAEPNGSS